MKKCYDYDTICAYIENDLNQEDRLAFEKELEKDANLKLEYKEIKFVMNSLSKFPEKSTSSDFLVNLNNKIDEYEMSKKTKWYSNIFNIFGNSSPLQLGLGAMTAVILIVITVFALDPQFDNTGNNSFSADVALDKEKDLDEDKDSGIAENDDEEE